MKRTHLLLSILGAIVLMFIGTPSISAQTKGKVTPTKNATKATTTGDTKTVNKATQGVPAKKDLKTVKVGRASASAAKVNADKRVNKSELFGRGTVAEKFSARAKTKATDLRRAEKPTKLKKPQMRRTAVNIPSRARNNGQTSQTTNTQTNQTNQPAQNTQNSQSTQASAGDELMLTSGSYNGYTDYSAIDNAVKNLNIPTQQTVEAAARTIISTSRATTTKQKARAIYSWIATHVSFDVNGDLYDAADAWTQRKGKCQAYSLLLQEMCRAVGIEADYVSGYGKMNDHVVGSECNYKHGWNVVYDNGNPIIMDVTWGAGYVENGVFTYDFEGEWFDVDPYAMIFSHWPRNSNYQFTNTFISKKQYEDMPYISPRAFVAGIKPADYNKFLGTHKKAWCFNDRPYLVKAGQKGLKLNKIQMTDELKLNEEYTFNVTLANGLKAYIGTGTEEFDLTSGQDAVITPKSGDNLFIAVYFPDLDGWYKIVDYKVSATGTQRVNKVTDMTARTTSYPASQYDDLGISYLSADGTLTIPEGRKTVKEKEFFHCKSVKRIVLPSTIETIERDGFMSCENLTAVEFPERLNTIGPNAFADCTKLTEVETGANTINQNAFWAQGGNMKLHLKSSVSALGNNIIERSSVLYVAPNTYAERYASSNDYAYMIEQ